jgi:fluoride ion exporter CrcB/FEX
MDITLATGIIGTVVLIAAWAYETVENIRKRKLVIHPHFAALYIVGNSLLVYYAHTIQNAVFFWLGVALLAAIIGELCYSFKLKQR